MGFAWRIVAVVVVLLATTGVVTRGHTATPTDTKPAEEASLAWLGMIDSGKYGEGWEVAATYFKGHINKQEWETQVKAARAPLGNVLSRKLKMAKFESALPGAPDGEYVVMQYEASFKKKASAVETITFAKDSGTWKLVGYFIK